jgi:hypothetical protein
MTVACWTRPPFGQKSFYLLLILSTAQFRFLTLQSKAVAQFLSSGSDVRTGKDEET